MGHSRCLKLESWWQKLAGEKFRPIGSKDSFSADSFSIYPETVSCFWNTGHILDRDHVYILICLWSVTDDVLVQASKQSSAVKRLVVFCCCCFYQDVNTRGRHSMMCTLWMGWQVIDSMKMEKRWRSGGEGRGRSRRGVRDECVDVWGRTILPLWDSPKTLWCVVEVGVINSRCMSRTDRSVIKLTAHWNTPVTNCVVGLCKTLQCIYVPIWR